MSDDETRVYIVDDDPAIRDSLSWLVQSVGLPVETFTNGIEFLENYSEKLRGCTILDLRMPGMSGIEVFEEMKKRGFDLPVVFLTGHGDVHLAVRAMKSGAFDFLEKPFNDQHLLDLIQKAIRQDNETRNVANEISQIRERMDQLTKREKEVLDGVVDGDSNRVIASRLNLSEKTIEFHRAKLMEKMKADSLANLIRMVTHVERSEESPGR